MGDMWCNPKDGLFLFKKFFLLPKDKVESLSSCHVIPFLKKIKVLFYEKFKIQYKNFLLNR